jgi:hypothetical protein
MPAAIPVIAAVASTAYSIYSGERAASAQNEAQAKAEANAKKTADAADQANNKANQKRPDTGALASANEQAAKGGPSGTMLTGAQGIDPGALQLGKNTLLGG